MSIFSWRRRRLDEADLDDEIRAHLKIAADERVADGADRRSAELASQKAFGNVTLATEAARRVWRPWWLEALHDQLSDVRYATRALFKDPVFSLTVIGVLTLGIGVNAAVFTMLKSIALSPLAGVNGSAKLAIVYAETSAARQLRVSYPDYQYLRDHDLGFTNLFGTSPFQPNLGRGKGARQVWGELVTGNYFQALGIHATIGRLLVPSDEGAPGQHPVVVISDGLWRRDFGADPDIVGRTIEINNNQLTIVGVADPAFHGTTVVYDVEVYVPVTVAPLLGYRFGSQEATPSGILADRSAAVFYPQGYLRSGTTLASAAAATDALWPGLARDRPLTDTVQRLRVVSFWRTPGGAPSIVLPTLIVLTVMGLLVLMIACANIAGLVLVRGVSRRGEIAVRLALGATRTRIIRLLIVENVVLAMPGAVLGVLLARWAIPVLVAQAESMAAPDRVFFNVGFDSLVMAFAVLVACGSALAFGFVPALQSSRVDLVSVINEDASPRGASRGQLRGGLVVAQVAVSLLLLIGAGLATRSVEAARRADPGFDPSHTTAVTMDVKQNGYDESQGRVFYRHLLTAARRDAGIESATLAAFIPMGFLDTPARKVAIEGYTARRDEDLTFMSNTVASDYFRTLKIPLRAGRDFEDRDDETATPVAVVNETLAHRFWDGAANALGKRIRVGDNDWRTVVGVAADVKYSRIDEAPHPYVYLPFLQSYRSNMVLHTRGAAAVNSLVDQARANVAALDPDLPILSARPMEAKIRGALILLNLTAAMLFIFGSAGMALAALGIYGLLSYIVKQSTHEIGVRMALGAPGASVIRDFVARGLRLGAIGAFAGTVAALAVTRLLGGILYGVSPTDLTSFGQALGLVLGVVAIATAIPAWRAARTNVLAALRHQ
ncbi:MAG TPA: ABC transporter permease [Vicinamibacterales bacterium]